MNGPPRPDTRQPLEIFFLAAALSLALVVPMLGIPVYFRTDDVHWLGWAASHANPLAALDPGQNLFGYYRPLPTMLWWLLFRLFGFEPLGYQLVVGFLGVAAMWPLARIGHRVAGAPWGGLAAVALFHAAFLPILYFYYWFSALTFALEIVLLALALDALTDGPGVPARPVRFVVLALLAGLAKQPALLVIPAVALPCLALSREMPRHRWAWSIGIALSAILLMLITPFVAQRPEALGRLADSERTGYILERLRFYSRVLLSHPAGPLAAAGAMVAVTGRYRPRSARSWLVAAALTGLGLGLALARLDPVIAIIPWLGLLGLAAVAAPTSRPWLAGFLVPAVALLGVDFHVSTYLLEPAIALTVAVLIWWAPLLAAPAGRVESWLAAQRPDRLAIALPILALVASACLHDRVPPIVTMRDVRFVFRQAAETVLREAPVNTVIGYLSYEELGETYADIRRQPLDQRVERHKTMNGPQLGKFFRIRGRSDLTVVPVSQLDTAPDALVGGPPGWLLAVTATEREHLAARPGAREIHRFRRGLAESALFRVE